MLRKKTTQKNARCPAIQAQQSWTEIPGLNLNFVCFQGRNQGVWGKEHEFKKRVGNRNKKKQKILLIFKIWEISKPGVGQGAKELRWAIKNGFATPQLYML